jgi:4-amino-4-deoxy-L-arabinose transferase-like glycosyltransferase
MGSSPRTDRRRAPDSDEETRTPSSVPGRVAVLIGLVTVVAGTFLRVWQLDAVGFNSDEAVYAGQAASIAGHPEFTGIFPIFRAHPLLFQFVLALLYHGGVSDLIGRLLAVAFGLAGVWLVYRAGNLLYGRRVGLVAALLLALMPYHVVVTRQVLLDGPMTTFAALTVYLLARYAITERAGWLYAAGVGLGLIFLAKEIGIVFIPAVYAFLALSPSVKVRLRDIAISFGCAAVVIAPFPLSLLLGGGTEAGKGFLSWQLFRPPNHSADFYLATVPRAMGLLVLLAATLALALRRRQWTWRENLLVVWIAVPLAFFQLWPVKGFQYLLPTAPAVVILAARGLVGWTGPDRLTVLGRRLTGASVQVALVTVVGLSLVGGSWLRIDQSSNATRFLAGSGGVPGGRAAGRWLRDNAPTGSQMIALGPSMANILQFYGHQRVYGLSVSSNPLRRNPAYDPVGNPDRLLREGRIQYIVWDAYSAGRSRFYAKRLLGYAKRYHGRVVHTETVLVRTATGEVVQRPVIVIFQVRQ